MPPGECKFCPFPRGSPAETTMSPRLHRCYNQVSFLSMMSFSFYFNSWESSRNGGFKMCDFGDWHVILWPCPPPINGCGFKFSSSYKRGEFMYMLHNQISWIPYLHHVMVFKYYFKHYNLWHSYTCMLPLTGFCVHVGVWDLIEEWSWNEWCWREIWMDCTYAGHTTQVCPRFPFQCYKRLTYIYIKYHFHSQSQYVHETCVTFQALWGGEASRTVECRLQHQREERINCQGYQQQKWYIPSH